MFNSSHLVFTRQITVANNVYLSFPLTIAENHANVTWYIFVREKGFNNRQLCLGHSVHIYKLLCLFVKKGLCKKKKTSCFFLLKLQWICFYILPPPRLITTTTETTTTLAIQNNKFVLSHDNAKITKYE